KFKEYSEIIKNSVWGLVPSYIRYPLQEILRAQSTLKILEEYSSNSNKSHIDRIKGNAKIIGIYLAAGAGIAAAVVGIIFGLHPIHSLSSNHIQYLGSQNGYEAFVPHNTINYHGHTDPVGDLILPNGTTIHNDVIWNGQYASTIIQNHEQIVPLNSQFVGQTDPVNNQQYVPLQDFYVIKGQVPVQQVTINGQTYYVIEANNINPANIAGFYTYDKWVPKFVVAINTPGTYAARLPGNSPVFQWTNTTGIVASQTLQYNELGAGGYILVLPNKIIPYGILNSPSGSALANFDSPQQVYNLPS
ncbi:MAG: hypothetical protein RXQ77_02730, partial [Candidatus Nanopusillus sp.]